MSARRAGERGLSLVEALVATAVMSVAIVIALGLYDASRKAFAKGENATEQQESVRIAFDELSADLRMLGYDVNPDGNPTRPDEQLEGALDHAIVFRSDRDAGDAVTSVTPETALAGGAFATVSTGNDEIVAYVLSKPDGTGPDAITFEADVKEAKRDGTVEPVTIANVVLNPTAPPYTLYRVSLNNDASKYGSPAFIVRTPVAENVRDLSFVYHAVGGTFKDPSATISELPEARQIRSGLTRVDVSLVGMTRQQDRGYSDAMDPVAPTFRKFELKGDVTPRNMRLKGILDLEADLTPPSKPAMPSLAPGHCCGLIVSWVYNPPSDGVTQYRINWGSSATSVAGSRNIPGSPFFLDGLERDTTYYVTIQARDAEGNTSARSDPASATTTNVNTPSAPATVTTSTDEPYHVTVSWTPVTTNTSSVPAVDPIAPRIRDLAGYRLYWRDSPSGDNRPVVDESVLAAGFAPPYYDTPVVACQDRYYFMTAVDACGLESAPTAVSHGVAANTGILPKPPTNVQAHFLAASTARVRWNPITEDVSDTGIMIDRYQIYRSAPISGASPPSAAVWGPTPLTTATGTSYIDYTVPPLTPGVVVYYRITGTDSCGNVSAPSAEARLECMFTGDVEFEEPREGRKVSGMVTTTVSVTGGSESYSGVTITYVHRTAGLQHTYTSTAPGPTWTDSGWRALPIGEYTITATVTTDDGCPQSAVIEVTARAAPGGRP
jgi:hypothetical protein